MKQFQVNLETLKADGISFDSEKINQVKATFAELQGELNKLKALPATVKKLKGKAITAKQLSANEDTHAQLYRFASIVLAVFESCVVSDTAFVSLANQIVVNNTENN